MSKDELLFLQARAQPASLILSGGWWWLVFSEQSWFLLFLFVQSFSYLLRFVENVVCRSRNLAASLCSSHSVLDARRRCSIPWSWQANGTVYYGWQGGKLYAIEGSSGAVLSHYSVDAGTQGEPAIGPDGAVYFATCTQLLRF